ncbi:hypothetical protein SSBR45G_53160 [Bradyrhizobium sp. SSBR45G]|uniref:hypothetical protein n=1 Tax=unclassified Bradyrhizobium TaxID=2631580 RepID=UPI002342A99E|nr:MULTISPECIES: hypothetical protein [unclassified Bradyrhizobium]GLH80407.1 hypothetical protein SSBR45G_53160 [Bradyrhizobium sp. SSBR45G]GLH84757.1 hypothetical protein SSBR45R_22170 [Bradyrhizobium sp. SSBR45R]
MDKKIAGLLGAVAAVGALGTVQASAAPAPADVLKVNSYADLLEPIPDAARVLQALDEQGPQADEPKVQLAQWYHHHHHHHHHHGYYRGPGYGYGYGYGYGPRVYVVPRRYYHHHHHHHHHHWYYDRY